MTHSLQLILGTFVILQLKHFLCDFVLQKPYQYLNKGKYGHPGGFVHAGLHALTGMAAFLVLTPSMVLGASIVLGEFVLHYHVDWLKEQITSRHKWVFPQAEYWWSFGVDQIVHQFTYIVIVGLLATGAGL